MALPPMKEMIDYANEWVENRFKETGIIVPVWHAMDDDGQHFIIPSPSSNKDLVAQILRMIFKEMKIVRYLFIDEAWVVRFPDHTPVEQVRAMMKEWGNKSLKDHPYRKEFIIFYLEDALEGTMEADREIIREGDAKPTLGPLTIHKMSKMSEGRFIGMLPNLKGTQQ